MPARGRQHERGNDKPPHAWSVTRKVLGGALVAFLATSCETTPTHSGFDARPCTPDPLLHDEDGDGFPDSCDVCPTVVDPLQSDTSETTNQAFPDGVGDACDIAPGLSGEDLAALYTFVEPTPRLIGTGWTVADDAASATDPAQWTARDPEVGDGLAVRARVATWSATTGSIVVATDGDAMASGLVCALVRDRDGDGRDELDAFQITGAMATKSVPALAGDFTLTAWRAIDRDRTGRLQCELRYNTTATQRVEVPMADDTTTGFYVLGATGGGVTLSSVAVYTQPLQPCPAAAACEDPTDP